MATLFGEKYYDEWGEPHYVGLLTLVQPDQLSGFANFFANIDVRTFWRTKGLIKRRHRAPFWGGLSLSVNFEITRPLTASVVNPVMIGFLKRYRKRLSKQQWYPNRKVFPFEGGLAESGRIECYSRELARSHGVADAIHVSREND